MTIKYIVAILLGVILLSSCGEDHELEGHWHLYVDESDKYNHYVVLNIKEDTIIDFDQIDFLKSGQEIGYLKNGKNIDTDSQLILLYNGMYGLYDYYLEGNRVQFKERNDITAMGVDYWGLRVNENECNKIDDLFAREQVGLSLPRTSQEDSIVALMDGFVFDIMIGYGKISKLPAIQIGHNLIETNDQVDLSIEFEKFKVKIPEGKRDKLIMRLTTDKNLSVDILDDELNSIMEYNWKQKVIRKLDDEGNITHVIIH